MHAKIFPNWGLREHQRNNIAIITFWSMFSSYALNSVLILFLTKPLLHSGLGYDQTKAYAFMGVSQATGYLMAIFGGYVADKILGIRRSILLGSILLASAFLLVMLSGYTLANYGDRLFILAYSLIPATSSLLIGTASGLVSTIYGDEAVEAKSAMTIYYMAINIGALLAIIIAPELLDSQYGPLSILAISFMGKSLAAYNFARKYHLYDNVIIGKDLIDLSKQTKLKVLVYLSCAYLFTLFAYTHVYISSTILSLGSAGGIGWFLANTLKLSGITRTKQLIAILLLIEAIVFFLIYNQMNSTLVLFAKLNSDSKLLGFTISPAQFQVINPILIIILGTQLPRFYARFPKFTIPYQFACGTMLAGLGLLTMAFAATQTSTGYVTGNYVGLTYIFITLAELWVSAIGLSMIGLYCDQKNLAFAMGVWYLASSLSNTISGRLASFVAIPEKTTSPLLSLPIFQSYYLVFGLVTIALGALMLALAIYMQHRLAKKNIILL
jgi:POT family proton-dependent oligopeptide transporter